MFESKETWEKEFERAKDLIADIQKVAGTLCESRVTQKRTGYYLRRI